MRFSYEKSKRFAAQFHVVTGYNLFVDNNDVKSYGLLLNYQVSDQLDFSYTNLYGRESVEGVPKQRRFYQNFYANWEPTDQISIIVGGDMSSQTNSELSDSTKTAFMFNTFAIGRYAIDDKYSVTSRFEVFDDADGFISGTLVNRQGEIQGLQATAFTIGVEYAPTKQSYLRAETRWTTTDNNLEIFSKSGSPSNSRVEFMINMGFYFNKRLR